MASLGSFNEDQKTFFPYCGGSLIGSSHLITAAHCLFGIDGEQTIEEFIAGYANKYLLDKTQSCVKRNQDKVPRLEKKNKSCRVTMFVKRLVLPDISSKFSGYLKYLIC